MTSGSELSVFYCDNILFTGAFLSDREIVVGGEATREPFYFALEF